MRHVACVLSFLLVALCPSELWLPTFADLVPGGDPFDVAADGEQVIVASNLRGDTVIVWVEEGAPRYQLFDSGGALRGVVRTILTEGECTAFSPAVAMDASGNFVIAFMCQVFFPGVPPAPGLLARRFDADGDPLGEEFRPFTTLAASGWPAVSMTATGDFVVAATGLEFAAVVGKAFAHVVQQQVAVRADHLVGQFRFGGVRCRGEGWPVATLATGLVEQILAGQYLRCIDVAACRHCKVTGVKQHQAQDVVADFWLAIGAIAIGCLFAGLLGVGAVIKGSQGRGEAHITRKRVNILLIEIRLPGFPAKTPQPCAT